MTAIGRPSQNSYSARASRGVRIAKARSVACCKCSRVACTSAKARRRERCRPPCLCAREPPSRRRHWQQHCAAGPAPPQLGAYELKSLNITEIVIPPLVLCALVAGDRGFVILRHFHSPSLVLQFDGDPVSWKPDVENHPRSFDRNYADLKPESTILRGLINLSGQRVPDV